MNGRRSLPSNRSVVLCAFVLLLVSPSLALACGKAGHRVVATLATSLLTPEAYTQIAVLHQPLHVVGADRGGNDVLIRFSGRRINLHRLSDRI